MEATHGKHTKPFRFYWTFIGLGLGIVIGASTNEWIPALIAGIAMGVGMAFMATKPGVDQ
ncbi:MAG: hypothetical protein HY063_10680 [Bacteroidetes bacterium]|nr:hypothetical protein [Bacteroidota bacterium]